jgi:hypothetical protein
VRSIRARIGGAVIGALAASALVMSTGAFSLVPGLANRPGTSQPDGMRQPAAMVSDSDQIAAMRIATAKYATDLGKAKAAGYRIITMMMPNMGIHYMNPKITKFDIRMPPILVYEHTASGQFQLGALEWVFPTMPKNPPLPNATFGSFPAACHYSDGTFIPHKNAKTCPPKAPKTGAAFTFWHPDLVTMHVWVWYPNPAGLFSSTNPLVAPFNKG